MNRALKRNVVAGTVTFILGATFIIGGSYLYSHHVVTRTVRQALAVVLDPHVKFTYQRFALETAHQKARTIADDEAIEASHKLMLELRDVDAKLAYPPVTSPLMTPAMKVCRDTLIETQSDIERDHRLGEETPPEIEKQREIAIRQAEACLSSELAKAKVEQRAKDAGEREKVFADLNNVRKSLGLNPVSDPLKSDPGATLISQ